MLPTASRSFSYCSFRTRCLLWLSAAGAAWIIVTAVAVVLYVHVRGGSSIANGTSVEVSLDSSRQLTVQVSSGGSGGGVRPPGPQIGPLAGGRTSGTSSGTLPCSSIAHLRVRVLYAAFTLCQTVAGRD